MPAPQHLCGAASFLKTTTTISNKMTTQSIIIAVITGLSIYFTITTFGAQKKVWRYYYRSFLNKIPDTTDTFPYHNLMPGFVSVKSNTSADCIAGNISGNDPKCIDKARFGTEFNLLLQNKSMSVESKQPGTDACHFAYSGAMMRSQYKNRVYEFLGNQHTAAIPRPFKSGAHITVPSKKNVTTRLYLQGANNPAHKIGLMECYNRSVINIFGRKYAKLWFTAYEHDDDGQLITYPTFLWQKANQPFYLRFEIENDTMHWYINGYLVKTHPVTVPANTDVYTIAEISAQQIVSKLKTEKLSLRF